MKKLKVLFDEESNCYRLSFKVGNAEILEEHSFYSIDDEVCELKLVVENEKYYLFGSSPNTSWLGFDVTGGYRRYKKGDI